MKNYVYPILAITPFFTNCHAVEMSFDNILSRPEEARRPRVLSKSDVITLTPENKVARGAIDWSGRESASVTWSASYLLPPGCSLWDVLDEQAHFFEYDRAGKWCIPERSFQDMQVGELEGKTSVMLPFALKCRAQFSFTLESDAFKDKGLTPGGFNSLILSLQDSLRLPSVAEARPSIRGIPKINNELWDFEYTPFSFLLGDHTIPDAQELPSDFKAVQYVVNYPDLRKYRVTHPHENLFIWAPRHYIRHGQKEGRSYMKKKTTPDDFDCQSYLDNYPDLQAAVRNKKLTGLARDEWLRKHFATHGKKEGRSYMKTASDDFNCQKYLDNYPDLQAAVRNKKLTGLARDEWLRKHFATHGKKEGRSYK